MNSEWIHKWHLHHSKFSRGGPPYLPTSMSPYITNASDANVLNMFTTIKVKAEQQCCCMCVWDLILLATPMCVAVCVDFDLNCTVFGSKCLTPLNLKPSTQSKTRTINGHSLDYFPIKLTSDFLNLMWLHIMLKSLPLLNLLTKRESKKKG